MIINFYNIFRYSRRRLSRSSAGAGSQHQTSTKCTCSAPPSAAEWNCVESGGLSGKEVFVNAGYVYPSPGPAGVHSAVVGGSNFSYHGGAKVTQVLQPPIYSRFMAAEPDTWSLQTDRSSHSGRRLIIPQLNGSSHNVIVNPLPPLPHSGETPYAVPAADLHYPYNHLLSDTHANKPSNPPTNSPAQTNTKPADISFEQNTNSSEDPIYQEIGVGKKEKINNNDPTNEYEKDEENVSNESEANTGKVGQKKEIEYWQITAKEVVKFRPCTETFINRNNV